MPRAKKSRHNVNDGLLDSLPGAQCLSADDSHWFENDDLDM